MSCVLPSDNLPENYIPSTMYSQNVIKIKQSPPSNLFFSLSKEEQKTIPWFSNIYQSNTSSLVTPQPIPIVPSQKISFLSEDQIDKPEPNNEKRASAKKFADDLKNMKQCIVKDEFVSTPIIDKCQSQGSLMFPYRPEPVEIKSIEISGISFDDETIKLLKGKFFVDMFTYAKLPQSKNEKTFQPYSEIVRVKFDSDKKPMFYSFKKSFEKAILPYPDVEDVKLVLMLFTECKDNQNVSGELVGICSWSIRNVNEENGDVLLKWVDYKPGNSLQHHFQIIEYKSITSSMKVKTLSEFSTENLCRLTSTDNIHPTPLFTIFDLSIDFNHSLFNSKSRIVLGASLKKIPFDQKLDPKAFPAFMSPVSNEKTEIGYSHLVLNGEKITILEPLNFYLDFAINEPILLIIEVFIIDKGKLNLVLSGTTKITKQFETHTVKMESRGFHVKAAFSRVENILTFTTLFPSIVCPSNPTKQPLLIACDDTEYDDPMFKEIAPYAIQKCLALNTLESIDFNKFFKFFIKSDMVAVQVWIEHFFTPVPGFTKCFTELVMANLKEIVDYPMPFFLLIFKSMCVENTFDLEYMKKIFKTVADFKSEKILKSASDLLIQLRMFFDIEAVHKIAYYFISLLETKDRFLVFEYIFSDITFIAYLALRKYKDSDKPYSPYVPLLSLFYRTVTNAFLVNDAVLIKDVADSLSIIAFELEQYVKPDEALIMAKILFPLLPLIFTYYDSLSAQIEKKYCLTPILLFLVKNCNSHQFLTYYSMLSNDSRIRFLEFLIIIYDTSLDPNFAKESVNFSGNPLNCRYEVTWRMLYFISHLLNYDIKEKLEIQEIISLLFHILNTPNQPSNVFAPLFKIFSSFVCKFADLIFSDANNTLIIPILTNIIPITQMKLLEPRMFSIGFIIWIIELEKKYNESSIRTHLGLLYSVTNSFLNSSSNYIPFWEYLPSEFKDIIDLYNKLKSAIELSSNEDQEIIYLLNICDDYKNFPSIRTEIYRKIVSINIKSSNFTSAFIMQWKLCGLIAEVFKLKGQFVEGIPKEGYSAFPYIVDEPPVDISSYSDHSKFLILESNIFTEESMSKCLQDALDYCIQAKLFWIIGDISSFLSEFLEKKRQFSLLKDVFEKISKAYSNLQSNEDIQIEFTRIAVSPSFANKTHFSEAIYIFPRGQFKELVPKWQKLYGAGIIDLQPLEARYSMPFIPSSSKETDHQQFIQVEPYLEDLYKLNAKTFTRDVQCTDVNNWNDILVYRYTFETEKSLPCCASYSKICKYHEVKITKEEFYIQKLKDIKEEIKGYMESYKAVLPPKKMLKTWSQYVSGISTTALFNALTTIVQSTEQKDPYYHLIYQIQTGQQTQEIPENIVKLCKEVWQVMKNLLPVIKILSEMNDFTEKEKKQFEEFCKYMNSKYFTHS